MTTHWLPFLGNTSLWKGSCVPGTPFLLSQMPVRFLHWGFTRIFKGKSFGEGWEEVKVGKRSGKELNHLKVSIILTLSLACHLLSIQCWDSLCLSFPHVQSWNHNRVKLREVQGAMGYYLFSILSTVCLSGNKCSFCPPPYSYSNQYVRSRRGWALGRRLTPHVNTSITHYWDSSVNETS